MESEKSREPARGRPPWQAPGDDDDDYHVGVDDDGDDDADGGDGLH